MAILLQSQKIFMYQAYYNEFELAKQHNLTCQ